MPSGRFVNVVGTPASPKFAEIVFMGSVLMSNGGRQPDVNVTHWYNPALFPGGVLATLAANIQSLFADPLADCKSDSWQLDSIVAQYIDDPTSAKEVLVDGTVGTVATDRSSAFNAAVMRKLSGLTGRSYRGSIHSGALPESFTTKDILNGTGTTAYNALVAIWTTAIAGVSDGTNLFYPIILSSLQSNRIANPSIFTGAFVTSVTLNLKVGTMKRRKEKGAA